MKRKSLRSTPKTSEPSKGLGTKIKFCISFITRTKKQSLRDRCFPKASEEPTTPSNNTKEMSEFFAVYDPVRINLSPWITKWASTTSKCERKKKTSDPTTTNLSGITTFKKYSIKIPLKIPSSSRSTNSSNPQLMAKMSASLHTGKLAVARPSPWMALSKDKITMNLKALRQEVSSTSLIKWRWENQRGTTAEFTFQSLRFTKTNKKIFYPKTTFKLSQRDLETVRSQLQPTNIKQNFNLWKRLISITPFFW